MCVEGKTPLLSSLVINVSPFFSDPVQCPYQCEHCGMRFISQEKMEKHKKNQSKVCFRFQCLHCDKKLSTMVGFTKHNQTVHDVTVEPVEIIEELVDINNQPIGTIFPDFENIQI